jgi:hypothetical protein
MWRISYRHSSSQFPMICCGLIWNVRRRYAIRSAVRAVQ